MKLTMYPRVLLLLVMLYSACGLSQRTPLEVSIGFGPTYFDRGNDVQASSGAMAYLSIGNTTLGAALFFSGDSRITRGGSARGRGSVGGFGWVKVLSIEEFSLKLNAGLGANQHYRARENTLADHALLDPDTGKAYITSATIAPLAGDTLSWRFLETSYLSFNRSLLLGVKLNY